MTSDAILPALFSQISHPLSLLMLAIATGLAMLTWIAAAPPRIPDLRRSYHRQVFLTGLRRAAQVSQICLVLTIWLAGLQIALALGADVPGRDGSLVARITQAPVPAAALRMILALVLALLLCAWRQKFIRMTMINRQQKVTILGSQAFASVVSIGLVSAMVM